MGIEDFLNIKKKQSSSSPLKTLPRNGNDPKERGAFLDILSNWIHLFLHGNLEREEKTKAAASLFFWGGHFFGEKQNRSFQEFLGGFEVCLQYIYIY